MKHPNLKSIIVLLLIVVTVSSCATIMQSTTQQVSFNSNPSGATVTINGQQRGTTPVIVDLKRKDAFTVKIELTGYSPYELALTRKISGWVWGNIVIGGLPGLVIDAATGGMYILTPEQVNAELRQLSTIQSNEDELLITVVMNAENDWEKVGQLTALK